MRRWLIAAVLAAGLFAVLRGIHGLAEPPAETSIYTDQVVVVGVTGRPSLTASDRAVLADRLTSSQVGAMSIRARYVGDCAAAGWTTLGAGRRAGVGELCQPSVTDGRVNDWAARLTAAAAERGDARLGTLAANRVGCVAAVGPGAAVAAARPDGTVADYRDVAEFLAAGAGVTCPLTLIDAGAEADQIIGRLAGRDDITVIVTGVGPAPGSDDPALQVVYRLNTTMPGWLTSASTRRDGVVTLTDLTRTLISWAPANPGAVPPVDGSPFGVRPAVLTVDGVSAELRATAALSAAIPSIYAGMGVIGALLVAAALLCGVRRRWSAVRVLTTAATALPGAMLLTGTVGWNAAERPVATALLVLVVWWAGLTGAVVALHRRLPAVPAPVLMAALTVAAFTVDAALGGPLQPGSLLNSRPIFGLRWYGFGNNTFAVYATSGLILAGYAADRLIRAGRRSWAAGVVALIGFGVVVCEGWPSMGSDFGGVVALTPPVLWLVLVVSGVRLSPLRLLVVGASAVVAVALIAGLDWRRGPDRRSHLGNFVQRIIDGDALDVVSRKATAAFDTVVNPWGMLALVFAALAWTLILRRVLPRVAEDMPTLRPALVAVLATAILGTLLNDGGTSVLATVTAVTVLTCTWFWLAEVTGGAETAPGPPPSRR